MKDIDELKSRIESGKIPSFGTSDGMLRSFWDGGLPQGTDALGRTGIGTTGIISRRCQIQAWPTACIIDHNGIIRYATNNFRIKTTPAWTSLGTSASLKDEKIMVPIIEGLLKSNDLRNRTYSR